MHKLVKIIIYKPRLVEIIIDVVLWYYDVSNFIIKDCIAIFIIQFWFLFYYFFDIKRWFFIAFYLSKTWTNGKIKQYYRNIFLGFYKLRIEWLGTVLTDSGVYLQ